MSATARAHWVTPDDPMPAGLQLPAVSRTIWTGWNGTSTTRWRGCRCWARRALAKVINGPIPYAPDGNPLIGPMPGVPNAFEACVFTFGIAQAGGAGKVLAEWVTEGATEWDMWSCDPRRFTDLHRRRLLRCQGEGSLWPRICDAFPVASLACGARTERSRRSMTGWWRWAAQIGAYNGWERANWFAQAGRRHLGGRDADLGPRAGRGSRASGRNARRCGMACGVLDLPGFSRFRLKGAGAGEWLSRHDRRHAAQAGADRPWLFPRPPGADRHRDVGR